MTAKQEQTVLDVMSRALMREVEEINARTTAKEKA